MLPGEAHYIGLDVTASPEGYIEFHGERIPVTLDLILRVRSAQGSLIAQMHANGDVEWGEGYTPTDAARVFWDGLSHHWIYLIKRDRERVVAGLSPTAFLPLDAA